MDDDGAEARKQEQQKRLEAAAAEFAAMLAAKNAEPDTEQPGCDDFPANPARSCRPAGGGNWVIRSPKRFS